MKTPEEWMSEYERMQINFFENFDELIEAIQRDACENPTTYEELYKDIAENLEYQLQIKTAELAAMRDKWLEARKYLRAANKGAERNAIALQLAASRINSMNDPLEGRVWQWMNYSDADLRLRMGELSAQEIRNCRALIRAILGTSKLSP